MVNIRIVEMICDILDDLDKKDHTRSRRELITFVQDRPGHDRRYAITTDKARQELAFSSKIGFEEGMRLTCDWYREYYEKN